MLVVSSEVNLSRESFVLNYLLILCFVIISTSLCLEYKPSLLISLGSSHSDNTSYNLNISLPIRGMVDFVMKRHSSEFINNSEITKELLHTSDSISSVSNTELHPSLKIEASKTTVDAGNSFSINCSTVSNQKLVLIWYKNSQEVSSHLPNIQIVKWIKEIDGKIFQWIHFTIIQASLKESGIYSCKAQNNIATASVNISVVTKEGIPCKSTENCNHSDFVCHSDNVCHCRNGTISKFGLCLAGKNINEHCLFSEECQSVIRNSECYSGICRCQASYRMMMVKNEMKCVHENAVKGSFCEDDLDCMKEVTNMICTNNVCDCDNHNYIFLKSIPGHIGKCYKRASRGFPCQRNEQCQATDRNLICNYNVCACDKRYIYLQPDGWKSGKCYRKASTMYDTCELDDQCFDVSSKAMCSHNNNLCVCRLGYYYLNRECVRQEVFERGKAQQVYRTAMIAAACFMIGVVSIFVVCIVKKSFCGSNNTSTLPGSQQRTGSQLQRMTSLTEEIIVADKPPSYEEVILAEIPTTPPPKYTDISKLFPITEGLQRHSSEPHLNILYSESSHNRSNSFHAYDNLATNSGSNIEVTVVPPPSYEEECQRSKPVLHLNIPSIMISSIDPSDETEAQNCVEINSESLK